jgi:hypothetical protein
LEGETKVLGENLAQYQFFLPQIPHDPTSSSSSSSSSSSTGATVHEDP